MFREEMKQRTKLIAINTIKLCSKLPNKEEFWIIKKQLMRSATSVGANYRSACRGRSTSEFVAKLGIVIEEADESMFWLELIESLEVFIDNLSELKNEFNQIISILTATSKSLKKLSS